MSGRKLKSLVAGVALALCSPLLQGATSMSDGFEMRVLQTQNLERARLGIAPLRWEPRLAQSAQRWADRLAATGRFEHAPEDSFAPEGENLWTGSRDRFSPEAMVSAWIREKQYFRSGTFPNNSTTGNVADITHYTQLVWRATGEVGCARATNARADVLVCRYAEAGNYVGERPF